MRVRIPFIPAFRRVGRLSCTLHDELSWSVASDLLKNEHEVNAVWPWGVK